MSFARLVLSSARINILPVPIDLESPDRTSAAVLAQECIDNVFTYYPILSETALFGSLDAYYQHQGVFGSSFDRWNTHMVIAIASLCRSRMRGDKHYDNGVAHASKALEEQEFALQPGNLASAQAILLLVVYSMQDPTHFNAWYLISVASRLLIDIGAHQNSSLTRSAKNWKPAEQELRQRLFHCTYTLDRFTYLAHLSSLTY